MNIKGSVSRDFRPSVFFHDSYPSGPLINRVKYFRIRFQFRPDIQIFKKLSGVHHTAESSSTVCIPPQSQAPRCASYRRVKLCGMHPTTESSSTVCIIPRSQAPRCASLNRVKLRGVHHTAESSSAVCIPPQSQAPRCASYRGVKLLGVHHTAESNCTQRSQIFESL